MHLTLTQLKKVYSWLSRRIKSSEKLGDDGGSIETNPSESEISDYLKNDVALACLILLRSLNEYTPGPTLIEGGLACVFLQVSFTTSQDDYLSTGQIFLAQKLCLRTGLPLPDPSTADGYKPALDLFEILAENEIEGLLRDFKSYVLDPLEAFFASPVPEAK